MDWSFFDKIYCINLYECEDRYNHIQNISKKYNMNVQFYRTHRNKNGAEGCFNSHIEIIKEDIEFGDFSRLTSKKSRSIYS